MSVKTIAAFLRTDIVSRTAAAVQVANPGMFPTTADVPVYLYKCLLEILTGSTANPTFLQTHVIEKYGAGLSQADSGIELTYMESESQLAREGMQSDTTGARTSYIKIMSRLHPPVSPGTNFDTTESLSARIEYILDAINRVNYRGGGTITTGTINPAGIDPSIDPKLGVFCHFVQDLEAPSSIEKVGLWRVEYTRIFAK